MKILFVTTGLNTGGAERALFSLISGGLSERYDCTVLSLLDEGTYGPRLQALGVMVYTLGMRRGFPGPATIWRLQKVLKELDPSIIQGWMYHGNLAASVAAGLVPGRRPAVVWSIRQSLYSLSAEKPLTRQVVRSNRMVSSGPGAIIYNSRLSRTQHESFGFKALNGLVIPNGFDPEMLRPDPIRGATARRDLGIRKEDVVIGHVARFHPMKDHPSFLRAAVELMRQRSDVTCLLVGRDVNLANPALAGIVPPELVGRFHFVGERDDVPNLMRTMDVFCQSSWSEAFPNVLGEAMALGVPCVATDVGDSGDIVGDSGEVVPPSNSSALAEGLMKMLERSSAARADLGIAARARIEARYALPQIVERYRGLYELLRPGL